MTGLRAIGVTLLLLLTEIAAGRAQELPSGGEPLPELRRGANGQIEAVPSAPTPRREPVRRMPGPAVAPSRTNPAKPTSPIPTPPVRVAAPPTPPAGPPRPVIELRPKIAKVPDTAPRGTVIAYYSVRMTDNSAFNGTVRFGPPFFDDNGRFALDGNRIIVNPDGPGIGPNKATVTNHITLEAVPENGSQR